jgi:hypothetical protein
LADETDAGTGETAPDAQRAPDDSIRASIERLVASGRELAEAELAWAKIKGRGIARQLRNGLVFATIALACLTVALTLLLVAAIVALAPLVGLLAAVLIVSAVAFVATALFGLLARGAFVRMMKDDAP